MGLETSADAHGVLLMNSNAMGKITLSWVLKQLLALAPSQTFAVMTDSCSQRFPASEHPESECKR